MDSLGGNINRIFWKYNISHTEKLTDYGKSHGYRWIHLQRIQAGFGVSGEIVRVLMKIFDLEGVAKAKRILRRRQYFAREPNLL